MHLAVQISDSPSGQAALQPERRRGLRIRQNRPVKIFEPVAARYFGGQTEDISASGVRIELPVFAPLAPGRALEVHVGNSQSAEGLAERRQMIPARVVWVDRQRLASRSRLVAGLEFRARAAAADAA